MEIITFFSFKGGVGRTQSLLNTACEFAQRGKNVLLIDFDLHAPGLSIMECMRPKNGLEFSPHPGAIDFFEWLVLLDEAVRRGETNPEPINLAACAYEPVITEKLRDGSGFLRLVPAACLNNDCSDAAGYSDRVHAVDSPLTEIIRRTHRNRELNPVIEQIRSQFSALPKEDQPDAIFIDARTGITGIADLLLTRSSDRIVIVTGLNQQNLWGLRSTLMDIQRSVETADWLRRISIVISPVPLGEHELTEKRTNAISAVLNRFVDAQERDMFGEVGLLPNPVEIPYDAQLALLEDPILLRHENSVPATRYRQLADRLGGKVEPLEFKEAHQDSAIGSSREEFQPVEHPLARVLPWDSGLSPATASAIMSSLGAEAHADKPYKGWLRHSLNYLANSISFSNMPQKERESLIRSLSRSPVAQRTRLLKMFREERQHLFSLPRSEWNQLASSLGSGRVSWLHHHTIAKGGLPFSFDCLLGSTTSASLWGGYWTSMAEALRVSGRGKEALKLLSQGSPRFVGRADFVFEAIQILLRMNEYEEAIRLADLTLENKPTSKILTAGALMLKGRALQYLRQTDAAFQTTLEALPIYREVDSRIGEANTLMSLGDLMAYTEKLEEARARYDEALPIFREVNGRLGEANTLRSLGDLLVRTDKPLEARARYDEALPIFREVNDRLGEANTLSSLGDLLARTDKLLEARARYDEALPIFREVNARLGEANTLRSLGDLLVRTDKLKEARERYDEALPIFREVNARLGEANTLRSLGDLLVRTAKLKEARECYDEALRIFREVNDRLGEANTYRSLGDLLVLTDKLEKARERYDDALQIYREINSRLGEANTLLARGDLLVRTDKLEEARERYDEALLIYREINARLGEANTLRSLGDLLVRTDKLEEARERYDVALPIYREVNDRLGEANTLQGLGKWHLAAQQFDDCHRLIEECQDRYKEVAGSEGLLEALLLSSKLHLARGNDQQSKAIAQEVIREAGNLGLMLLARETEEWLRLAVPVPEHSK